MGDAYRLLVLCPLILSFVFNTSTAQQTANRKCEEYLNFPKRFGQFIIGGSRSTRGEFPHMAALGFGEKTNFNWLCGGSIISENYILTAAHCTNHIEFGAVKVVRVGATNLRDEDDGVTVEISKIVRHPRYKAPLQYNDIALLKLKDNIRFSRSVLPACLNTDFNNVKPNRENKLITTGWGLSQFAGSPSDHLMKVELILYPHRQCSKTYNNISKRRLPNGINNPTQMCAGGGPNEEKDTCQGDSGGPLAMKNGVLYTVVGVTSFGKSCGFRNTPAVYTRISAYVPWIERNVWP